MCVCVFDYELLNWQCRHVSPYSSVVEHPLSKRKVGSSILPGGKSFASFSINTHTYLLSSSTPLNIIISFFNTPSYSLLHYLRSFIKLNGQIKHTFHFGYLSPTKLSQCGQLFYSHSCVLLTYRLH